MISTMKKKNPQYPFNFHFFFKDAKYAFLTCTNLFYKLRIALLLRYFQGFPELLLSFFDFSWHGENTAISANNTLIFWFQIKKLLKVNWGLAVVLIEGKAGRKVVKSNL